MCYTWSCSAGSASKNNKKLLNSNVMFYFIYSTGIMLIDGKKFHGSTSYVDKNNTFISIAGNASWFTEFIPIHFPAIRTFHKHLFHIYRHGLCCFMTGSFVSYISGFLNFFGQFRFI